MTKLNLFFLLIASSIAFSLAFPQHGSASLWIRNADDPPGRRCYLLNGWHWDRLGHHFFGTYRRCLKMPGAH